MDGWRMEGWMDGAMGVCESFVLSFVPLKVEQTVVT